MSPKKRLKSQKRAWQTIAEIRRLSQYNTNRFQHEQEAVISIKLETNENSLFINYQKRSDSDLTTTLV